MTCLCLQAGTGREPTSTELLEGFPGFPVFAQWMSRPYPMPKYSIGSNAAMLMAKDVIVTSALGEEQYTEEKGEEGNTRNLIR